MIVKRAFTEVLSPFSYYSCVGTMASLRRMCFSRSNRSVSRPMCVQEVTSSTARVYLQKESSLDLRSLVHCLSRHLTLCTSRTTPSGIIVAFSTIPPLHQFTLAEKKGNTLVSTFSGFCPAPFHFGSL